MAKLSLTQKPTFTATVQIPVLGGGTEPVQFTFKAKRRAEFAEWLDGLTTKADEARKDEDVVLDIASGWELEEPFNKKNIIELCEVHPGSGRAIVAAYINEYAGAKAGN